MTNAYNPAKAGDPILADDWNNMQIAAREHILRHRHTGASDEGAKLGGDSIDASASLSVKALTASAKLAIKDVDVYQKLQSLQADKLPLTGGAIAGALSVSGTLAVGSGWAVQRGKMAAGSLTIGKLDASFGGGTKKWNENTAGLLLETLRDTEIAVHDAGTRIASLFYYEGDADNRLTIGRDMGWGPIESVTIKVPGAGRWDRLVVAASSEWGNGTDRHVTIGGGGGSGIMFQNPHVSWYAKEKRASIRYGKVGSVTSGTWWDVGVREDGVFSFAVANRAPQLQITKEGKLGLGTAPTGDLTIRRDARGALGPVITLTNGVGAPGAGAAIDFNGYNASPSTLRLQSIDDGNYSSHLSIQTKDPGANTNALTERMRITSTGQVSISTNRDHLQLRRVKAHTQGGKLLFLELYQDDPDKTVPTVYPSIRFHHNGRYWHRLEAREDGLHVKVGHLDNDGYRKLVAGAFRISNPTDGSKPFEIRFESNNDTVVFYHQNGHGQYMRQDGRWQYNSDASLKQNVADLRGILDRVLRLRPVSFDWTTCPYSGIGFIAQEVEPLFPDLVSEHKAENGSTLHGLPYDTFAVLAIAAIQELKAHYDARIEALHALLRERA